MISMRRFAIGLFLWLAPAITALSPRGVDCDFATSADSGATCESFAGSWGLSVERLKVLNPDINCSDLDTSKSYCVIGTVNNNPPTSSPSPSTTLRTSTTKTASTITNVSTNMKTSTTTTTAPSNSPTMPGLAGNCDGFYKVSSGDQCGTIADKNGISLAQFLSWNTYINSQCSNLWLDYYVCVHVPGAATTTKQVPQPTNPASGPTPQMPNIIANCKRFYLVKSGDSCWSIYTSAGITLNQFLSWNKAVDSSCSNLWLNYYVCIGI